MDKRQEVASLTGLRLIGTTTHRSILKIQLNLAPILFGADLDLIYT